MRLIVMTLPYIVGGIWETILDISDPQNNGVIDL